MATDQPDEVTFSREEPYERLWECSASHFAKELGLSDVLLVEQQQRASATHC